jgi:flagellar biosynthetic protein FliO
MLSQVKSRSWSRGSGLHVAVWAGVFLLAFSGLAAPDSPQNPKVETAVSDTPATHIASEADPSLPSAEQAQRAAPPIRPANDNASELPMEFDEKSKVKEAFLEGATDSTDLADLLTSFARMMFMLLIVLALAYLFLHKGLGKLMAKTRVGKRIQVLEKAGLDQRRSLYLVQVDDKQFLLGGSDGGVTHIADVGASSVEANRDNPPSDFSGSLLAVKRKKQEGSVPVALVNSEQLDAVDDDGRPN